MAERAGRLRRPAAVVLAGSGGFFSGGADLRVVDASTALAWDVVDEVVAEDAVLARSLAVARERSRLPPNTYELIKRRLRAGASAGTRGLFGEDAGSWDSSEARDAAPAVLEDRRPDR